MSEGGNIIRIIGGKSEWIAEEEMHIIATKGDVVFSSSNKVSLEGKQGGHSIGSYDWKEDKEEEKDFPTCYWSYDYEGKSRVEGDNNHSFRTTLEKTVYFQLNVSDNVPIGTSIQFQLFDYDTGLFIDWLNPDDKKFGGQEVIKTATVYEVDGKKRITIELHLKYSWKKELIEDQGFARDGDLEFYWDWKYNGTSWTSDTKETHLSVYNSAYRLRIKPAYSSTPLPEIYSHKGKICLFAIGELPNGKIEKFVAIKIRKTTSFKLTEDVYNFKREVYTERINLKKNTLESVSYQVEEVNHIFKISGNTKQIYIDEKIVEVPIAKGSKIAHYNSVKKVWGGLKKGVNLIDKIDKLMILDEMRNMVPELSNNGKINLPSLSTLIGYYPGAQVIAFGVAVLEWIATDMIREMEELTDELMWLKWQNVKTKGRDAALQFLDFSKLGITIAAGEWAEKHRFDHVEVDQATLNDVLKGKYKDFFDLKNFVESKDIEPAYTVIVYKVSEPELRDYFYVIDSIFINKKDEKEYNIFGIPRIGF